MSDELRGSDEICEALVRHVETTGYDIFEKHFVRDGRVICTVWCVIGEEAEAFSEAVTEWVESRGYRSEDDLS